MLQMRTGKSCGPGKGPSTHAQDFRKGGSKQQPRRISQGGKVRQISLSKEEGEAAKLFGALLRPGDPSAVDSQQKTTRKDESKQVWPAPAITAMYYNHGFSDV